MIIWSLWHSKNSDPQKDCQLLGVFSHLDNLNIQLKSLSEIEPFIQYPDGFTVDKHVLDEVVVRTA